MFWSTFVWSDLGLLLPRFDCTNLVSADHIPDLLITVNFTTLGMDAMSLSDYKYRTVSIVVGLHNDTVGILRPLVPDMHLLGRVLVTMRYQYGSPVLASFGAFSSVRTSVRLFLSVSLLWYTRQGSTSQLLSHSWRQTLRFKFLGTTTLLPYACTCRPTCPNGASP